MKRIAFVIQDLFSQGAQYATALMVRGFVAKGYHVDLLVGAFHDKLAAEGKTPFETPPETNWIHLKGIKARQNIGALRRYLKTTDAEAVVSMCSTYDAALAFASVGLRRRPRLYRVEHGITFSFDGRKAGVRSRWVNSRFDGVMAVAKGVADELVRLNYVRRDKVSVVFNPVVDAAFEAKQKLPPTHPWLVNKSLPTFVCAGSFTEDKDHFTVMAAFNRLIGRARIIIYGKGPLREKYEEYIRANHLEATVSLPGFTECLPAEVKASDGYVSSSQVESFGIAIAEGLAAGVPVISTDAPCGPREILHGGLYGQLVALHDAEGLAEAVRNVLEGKVRAAADRSWTPYRLERIVERYERATGLAGQTPILWENIVKCEK